MAYTGTVDIVGGQEVVGELVDADGWEDVVLTQCCRCFEFTDRPRVRHGRDFCRICLEQMARQTQRSTYATSLAAYA